MSRLILTPLLAGAVAAGGWAGCQQAAPPATQSQPAPPASFSPDQQKAVDLAQAFLAKGGPNWGRPYKVEVYGGDAGPVGKGEDTYVVTSPTPPDEVKLVSERAVLVNVKTGQAALAPRR